VVIVDRQLSILLAEDDLISRRLIRILIEKLGHKVNVVENGKKAFEAFKDDHYDIILMDIQMPLMDGLECTRKIREYEKKHQKVAVMIIAVTAHAMTGDKNKCINAGMDDYITKPIEEQVLLNKINKFGLDQFKDAKVANIEKLQQLLENPADVHEIVSDYLEYYPRQIQLIKEKADQRAYDELANVAHKLKGSVSNFDAEQVVNYLKNLELSAEKKNQGSIEINIKRLEMALESLKKYLLSL